MKTHAAVNKKGSIYIWDMPCFKRCCYQYPSFIVGCDGWQEKIGNSEDTSDKESDTDNEVENEDEMLEEEEANEEEDEQEGDEPNVHVPAKRDDYPEYKEGVLCHSDLRLQVVRDKGAVCGERSSTHLIHVPLRIQVEVGKRGSGICTEGLCFDIH